MSKNKKYTGEFKEKVVKAYLSGKEGGSIVLARKYGISSVTQIKVWAKKYKKKQKSSIKKHVVIKLQVGQNLSK